MAVVVNNPQPVESNNGSGFLIGVILLIVLAVIFLYFGLPYLRGGISSGPQVNVPSNINVHTSK